jgi:hypothetical protein
MSEDEDEYEKEISIILEDLVFHTMKNYTNPEAKPASIVRKNIHNNLLKSFIGSIYEEIFEKKI